MLIYLDQNYASRIAKYTLGQQGHDHFGALYRLLLGRTDVIPPSPFHLLELRGGYLAPPFEKIFGALEQTKWVRQWQEILALQLDGAPLTTETLLTDEGSWKSTQAADVSPFIPLLTLQLTGSRKERTRAASSTLCHMLELPYETGKELPFVKTFAMLLAFRSLNAERQPRDSDLADLVIAATIQPYADIFATDRFVREGLDRLGIGENAYSGRRPDVERLLEALSPKKDCPTADG